MQFTATLLKPTDTRYPKALQNTAPPAQLWTIGNPQILSHKLFALFCSVKCPGDAILKTYDLARELRDAAIPVIGGFHSPMEQECLDLLLRGKQPVVICPARGIQSMRIPVHWRQPLYEGRLLIVSPFASNSRRPTGGLAEQRNRLVGMLADAIFIAYAEPEGKTERLCADLIAQGKPVYTYALETSRSLISMGANGCSIETIENWLEFNA